MARSRRVAFAALNVALHTPHPQSSYIALFQAAFQRRLIIRAGSLHRIMIGTMHKPESSGNALLLSGEIYRFVNIDPNQPWFNTRRQKPATEEDVEGILIPPYLLPHLQRIPFAFNAQCHRLWFVAKERDGSLAPGVAARFFSQLLQGTAVEAGLPEVNVTAIPDAKSVEEILALPQLEYLRIELVRPNPDSGESAEDRWLQRLEKQNASREKRELMHARGQVVRPDPETVEMAQVAANNGAVQGRGRTEDGLPVNDSTTARPMLVYEQVDTKIETTADVLNRIALEPSERAA